MDDHDTITFDGFNEPEQNWSKLPHQLIEALPLVDTLGEMKVILYVLRHTWGYHDEEKRISQDEFCRGRKHSKRYLERHPDAPERIDNGTGLSVNTVKLGIKRAVEHGFLIVDEDASDKARIKRWYRLAESDGQQQTVRVSDSDTLESESDTLESEPDTRTKKETLERKEQKGDSASAQSPVEEPETQDPAQQRLAEMRERLGSDWASVARSCKKAREEQTLEPVPREAQNRGKKLSPACKEYQSATGYAPPKSWRDEITDRIGEGPDDLKRWYDTCHAYVGCGWNPRNVKGMLDYYVLKQIPTTRDNGNGRHDKPAQPTVVVFPEPEYLMVDGV